MGSEIDSHCLRKYDCLEGLVLQTFLEHGFMPDVLDTAEEALNTESWSV